MQTPTHLLVAAAVLTRRGESPRNVMALVGALLPDLSIYVLFVWSKVMGIPEHTLWSKTYWQEPWQTLSALSNSIPIWTAMFVAGILLRLKLLWILAAAALLHLALDFPVHHSDAHKHFWPLTDWRFHSPLSYWNPAHYGGIVSAVEIALGCACLAVLWWRFPSTWVRAILLLAVTLYAAVPLYFRLMLG